MIHLLEDRVYCEVVDRATGEPVGPGEEGELVITPLQAEASPLLRFATGDRVRWLPPEACGCGRPFAGLEAGTITRFDDMLKIKMVNVWPDAIDAVVLTPAEVVEYEGEVRVDPTTGREEAVVSVEFHRETAPERRTALLDGLAAQLRERVGLHFAVREHDGPSLLDGTRDGLLKRRRWTDRRGRVP
jgi:phenylacetate-CoA ligase